MKNYANAMNSKLKLTNRKTGDTRIVSEVTWESMQRDGRSRYWTPEPLDKPKVKAEIKKEKEKIVIEPIKVSEPEPTKEPETKKRFYNKPKKEEETDGTN